MDVCRAAFLSIHGVAEKSVRVAVDKHTWTGTVVPDQKGRSEPGSNVKGKDKACEATQ